MWGRAGINEAVLAELRAIRDEIHQLSDRVSQAATREDLKEYLKRDEFAAHVRSHQQVLENWRVWLPWAIELALTLYALFGLHR